MFTSQDCKKSQSWCSVSQWGRAANTSNSSTVSYPWTKPLDLQNYLVLSTMMPHSLQSLKNSDKTVISFVDKRSHIISGRRCLIPNWIVLINIQRQLVMHQTQHLIEHVRQTTLIHKDSVAQTLWQQLWLRGMWHSTQPRRNEVTLSHLEERTEAG